VGLGQINSRKRVCFPRLLVDSRNWGLCLCSTALPASNSHNNNDKGLISRKVLSGWQQVAVLTSWDSFFRRQISVPLQQPTTMLLCRLGRLHSPKKPPSWSRRVFFTPAPPIRFFIPRRHSLWLVPVVGGLTLYFLPRQKSPFPSIFSSPTLIPCPSPAQPQAPVNPTIFSPSESEKTIAARISQLLREHLWEPILTAKRFVYLFALFVPVIVTSPMLLVGISEKRLKGDRWGALWWYGFLVRQMEAAGPTFIKVCPGSPPPFICSF
jgi:hypothetical protein